MLRIMMVLLAAPLAAPLALAEPPARVIIADPGDALFRSVAIGAITTPSREGEIRKDVRSWLVQADFLAKDAAAARYDLNLRVIETGPKQALPLSGRGAAALESLLTLVARDGGAVIASGRFEGVGMDAIVRGFAALALQLGEKDMAPVREAVTCAALNPDGLGGAYLTRTPTKVGVDCPR
jgi:hypothetical protein